MFCRVAFEKMNYQSLCLHFLPKGDFRYGREGNCYSMKLKVHLTTVFLMKYLFLVLGLALTACVSASPEAVKEYPSGYLCRLLGPEYISTPQEQINIYRELEQRGERCVSANGNINQTVVINN